MRKQCLLRRVVLFRLCSPSRNHGSICLICIRMRFDKSQMHLNFINDNFGYRCLRYVNLCRPLSLSIYYIIRQKEHGTCPVGNRCADNAPTFCFMRAQSQIFPIARFMWPVFEKIDSRVTRNILGSLYYYAFVCIINW